MSTTAHMNVIDVFDRAAEAGWGAAMVRVRVRGGQVVAKSWRAGQREPRGTWRSARPERLSRIRQAYRSRQR